MSIGICNMLSTCHGQFQSRGKSQCPQSIFRWQLLVIDNGNWKACRYIYTRGFETFQSNADPETLISLISLHVVWSQVFRVGTPKGLGLVFKFQIQSDQWKPRKRSKTVRYSSLEIRKKRAGWQATDGDIPQAEQVLLNLLKSRFIPRCEVISSFL